MGLVLLDLGDGECSSVELDVGHAGGDFAEQDLGSEFQLFGDGAYIRGSVGNILGTRERESEQARDYGGIALGEHGRAFAFSEGP